MAAAFSRKTSGGGFRRQRKKSENVVPRAIGGTVFAVAACAAVFVLFRTFQSSAFLPTKLLVVLELLCVVLWGCIAMLAVLYIYDLFRR